MKLLTRKYSASDSECALFGILSEDQPVPQELTSDPEVSILQTADSSPLMLPEGISRLEPEALSGSAAGKSVVLPASLRTIDCGALRRTEQVLVHPDNPLFRMENGCLVFSTSPEDSELVWVPDQPIVSELPDSVTEIRPDVFCGNSRLISVHLPRRLHMLPERAFFGCIGLRRVFLPRALEEIRYECFSECPALEAVIMEGSTMFRHFGTTKDAFLGVRQMLLFSDPNPWMTPYLERHLFARSPLEDAQWIIRREAGPEENREEEIHAYLMERMPAEYLVPSRFLIRLHDAGLIDMASLLSHPRASLQEIFSEQELEQLEDELARKSVYLQS